MSEEKKVKKTASWLIKNIRGEIEGFAESRDRLESGCKAELDGTEVPATVAPKALAQLKEGKILEYEDFTRSI